MKKMALLLSFFLPTSLMAFQMTASEIEALSLKKEYLCVENPNMRDGLDCWYDAVSNSFRYFKYEMELFNVYYQLIGAKGMISGNTYHVDLCFKIPNHKEVLQKTYSLTYSQGEHQYDEARADIFPRKCETE